MFHFVTMAPGPSCSVVVEPFASWATALKEWDSGLPVILFLGPQGILSHMGENEAKKPG